jgi:hypothetical protein
MKTPSEEERKRWWLLCHAYTALEKSETICQQIMQHCPSNDHPLFLPLSVSVHIFCGRAFKGSRVVGCLRDDIIPPDSSGIHESLLHFRDGVFAHTDANHFDPAGKPMHDVVYSVSDSRTEFLTSDPRPRPEYYMDVLKHCKRMKKIIFEELMVFHDAYAELLPTAIGQYLFILDPLKPLFEFHDMPVWTTLHYK